MKYEYKPYNYQATDEELLSDMKQVYGAVSSHTLTMKQYSDHGHFDCSTISRRFGSWNNALTRANIPINLKYWSKVELFENIENVWIKKGSQPRRIDMNNKELSIISSGAYLRKFGKWSTALKAFIEYINEDESTFSDSCSQNGEITINDRRTTRDVNLRLRFKVLKRDNFKCCMCGNSPAKDPSVELHIDHIVPWSKGGETELNNLHTLCNRCNWGKGNLDE